MKKNNKSKRNLIIVLLLFMVVISTISYSLAFLTWSNDPLINLFTKPNVDIEIEEDFDDEIKKDVVIRNDGNVDIYVRVALMPAWVLYDDDGVAEYLGYAVDEVNLTTLNGWIRIGDYYYYTTPLAPGASTTKLVGSDGLMAPINRPHKDANYKVDVISSSIQANPTKAVSDAWNVEVVNNEIVGER